MRPLCLRIADTVADWNDVTSAHSAGESRMLRGARERRPIARLAIGCAARLAGRQ